MLCVAGWALCAGPGRAQVQPLSTDTLALDEAVRLTLTDNWQARIARNNVDIAANNVSVGNAGFLPTLTAQANRATTISDTDQQLADGDVQELTGARTTQQGASAELRWTVFDGLGRFATYDRLEAERGVQRAVTESQVEAILADVVVTYYEVARQQQQLQVFREAVDISAERLRIAQARRDLGSASELEVRQALVDLNTDRASVLRQEAELASTKAVLNQLLARDDVTTAYMVSEAIGIDTTLTLGSLQTTALQQNPALREARRTIRVAEAERREIRSEYLPSLDATLSYGYSDLTNESGFFRSSNSYDFQYGLSITYDLFEGLNRRRRAQNASIRARNAELTVEDRETRIRAELQSTFASYRNRLQLIVLERENLDAAVANVEVALERFRLGIITSVELREVQEQRIQAESRLLAAQFEAKAAEVTLLQLSGQLTDRLAPGTAPRF